MAKRLPSCPAGRSESPVLLLDEDGWTDCSLNLSAAAAAAAAAARKASIPISSVGSYIGSEGALNSPIYAAFDHQGEVLNCLLDPHPHTPTGAPALSERRLGMGEDGPVHCTGIKASVHDQGTSDSSTGSTGSTSLVVPVVTSVTPRQCLVTGGELLTIRGRHFLQHNNQLKSAHGTNPLPSEIPVLDPRSTSYSDDFTPQSVTAFTNDEDFVSSGSTQDHDDTTQQSTEQSMPECEAAAYLKKSLVSLEVLVNEAPVPADQVYLLSDTEISFIMPTTAAGLATVIVRMTDYISAPPLSLPSISSSYQADTASRDTLESKVHGTSGFSDTDSSLQPPPLRPIVVRSDICGCEAGGVMVRDRKVKDIRLFFAPQRKLTVKEKEMDRERNKDKNISFFMTEGSSVFGGDRQSKCDDVEEDLFEGPSSRTFTSSRDATRKGWQGRSGSGSGSDSCSDSDAFMDDPPPHSRHSGNLKRKSNTSAGESRAIGTSQARASGSTSEGNSNNSSSSSSKGHTAKRLKGNRPTLDLFVRPSRTASTAARAAVAAVAVDSSSASNRVIDIDNDEDFSDDEAVVAASRREQATGRLAGRRKHRVIDDDDEDDVEEVVEVVGTPAPDRQTALQTLSDDELEGEVEVQDPCHDTNSFDKSDKQEIEAEAEAEIEAEVDAEIEEDNGRSAQVNSLPHASAPPSAVAGFALNKALTEAVSLSLDALIAHPLSQPFRDPVDPADAPGYLTVIDHPMDLSTVQASLDEGLYVCVHKDNFNLKSSVDSAQQSTRCEMTVECIDVPAFMADMRLVWKNCLSYNHHSDSIVKQAKTLHEMFERMLYEKIEEISVSFQSTNSSPALQTGTEHAESEGPTQETLPYSDNPTEGGEGATRASLYLPPVLEVKEGVVKYVLGSEQYVITFPYSKVTVEDTILQASIPIIPSLGLLRSLLAADAARYESQSTDACDLNQQELLCTPEGMEYCDTSSGSAQTVLHRYPCNTSTALYHSLVTHPSYGVDCYEPVSVSNQSTGSAPLASLPVAARGRNEEAMSAVRGGDDCEDRRKDREEISKKDALRAVEEGCIEALESMWRLQDSFSYCDILSGQLAPADCIYSPPSSPSSSSSTSLPCEGDSSGTVKYEESVEATLWHTRQQRMASYLSHSSRRNILNSIKRSAKPAEHASSSLSSSSSFSSSFSSSSSSSSSSSTSFSPPTVHTREYFIRKSYRKHIACVRNINIKHSDALTSPDPSEPTQDTQSTQETQGTHRSSSDGSRGDLRNSSVVLGRPVNSLYVGSNKGVKVEDEEDSEDGSDNDNEDDSDEEDDDEEEEDEESLFMEECRKLEKESLKTSAPSSASSASPGRVIVIEKSRERKKESSWQALGRALDSSYLRYLLRKQDLHSFVNDILCGEEGPFDNNCSTGLCTAMALDLLPMLGKMAQSESLKSAHHAEVRSLMRAAGEDMFDSADPSDKRRGRTRRSTLSSLVRFEHLTCATQLSEPDLEALLVYGFVAGRGAA